MHKEEGKRSAFILPGMSSFIYLLLVLLGGGGTLQQRQMYWAETLNVLHNRYECAGEHHITHSEALTVHCDSRWICEKSHIWSTTRIPSVSVWKSKKPYLELSVDCVLFLLSFADVLLPSRRLSLLRFPPLSWLTGLLSCSVFDWLLIHGWWSLWSVGWACSLLLQFTEHEPSWNLTRWKPPPQHTHTRSSLYALQLIIFKLSPPSRLSHLQL